MKMEIQKDDFIQISLKKSKNFIYKKFLNIDNIFFHIGRKDYEQNKHKSYKTFGEKFEQIKKACK